MSKSLEKENACTVTRNESDVTSITSRYARVSAALASRLSTSSRGAVRLLATLGALTMSNILA